MDNKEYFLKKLKKNESKILVLQAQNAKIRDYFENDKFPNKNGKKPKIKSEKIEKNEAKEQKSIIDCF